MTLQVTTEPRENRQLAVSIEVPQERVERELHKAATKVASQYRLPGFRAGKAPYHVVVQQFGLGALYNEFVDELGQEVYEQALKQESITPYAVASIEDIQFDPLVYKLVVPLPPVVKLGDYRSIRIEEPAPESNDEAVNRELDRMLEQHATWAEVSRPSDYGDEITLDVKSVIHDGEKEIVVLDETDWEVTPDKEAPMDPPGFDEALIGMSAGEAKEFSLSWPEDARSIHAGKTAEFKVTVKKVEAYEKPALDDAFAQHVNPNFATLDELRADMAKSLAANDEARLRNEYVNSILDAVIEKSTLEYPPAFIENQMDAMMAEFEQRLAMYGIDDMGRYFQQVGQDPAEYRESLRETATTQARRRLVLTQILSAEQISVDHEEIDARIEETLKAVRRSAAEVEEAEAEAVIEDAVELEATEPGSEDEEVVALETVVDDEILEETVATDEEESNALAQYLHTAQGHMMIENDLLQEKGIERLMAIARGEPIPDLPAPAEGPTSESPAVESASEAEKDTEEKA